MKLILVPLLVADNLDATEIPDHSNVNRVGNLLGVTSQQLVDALTRKTIFAQGDTVVSLCTIWQSPPSCITRGICMLLLVK